MFIIISIQQKSEVINYMNNIIELIYHKDDEYQIKSIVTYVAGKTVACSQDVPQRKYLIILSDFTFWIVYLQTLSVIQWY